jgi:hypothetical protein
MGHDVWIIDDLSTGLHPDQWLGGASQAGAAGGDFGADPMQGYLQPSPKINPMERRTGY